MKYKITLNNRVYEVVVEKGEAILEAEYEANLPTVTTVTTAPTTQIQQPTQPIAVSTTGGKPFTSPFQGTVVAVKCEVGKSYKAGDVVFVVESMKMENDISLDTDGTIAEILVTKGQEIKSSAVLCTLK